jgi:hypothetical protein
MPEKQWQVVGPLILASSLRRWLISMQALQALLSLKDCPYEKKLA